MYLYSQLDLEYTFCIHGASHDHYLILKKDYWVDSSQQLVKLIKILVVVSDRHLARQTEILNVRPT